MSNLKKIQHDFERDGFVIVQELFQPSEAKKLKDECRFIIQKAKSNSQKPQQIANHGVYVGLAVGSSIFQKVITSARILDILEVILAPNIEFLSDKAVFKDEMINFASPWHQDWHYWGGQHKISLWVALDDADIDSGCLKLIPGSHRKVNVHDGIVDDDYGFGHRVRSSAIDESDAVVAKLSRGDAVFFHDLTLHASYPNVCGRERWVWIPTYRDAITEDPDYSWAVAAKIVLGHNLKNSFRPT